MSASKYIQTQAIAISKKAYMHKTKSLRSKQKLLQSKQSYWDPKKSCYGFQQNGTMQTRTVMKQTKDVTDLSKNIMIYCK